MKKIPSIMSLLLMLLTIISCGSSSSSKVNNVDAKAFQQSIQKEAGAILLDVRTPDEFNQGHIEGAVNINFNDKNFGSQVMALDKTKPILVYCLSGGRSGEASGMLAANGFTNVTQLNGGLLAWKGANLPVAMSESIEVLSGMTVAQFNQITTVMDKMVIVDFNATWCKPCKLLAPILEEIEKENPTKVKVVQIDIDENPDIAKQFKVESIPLVYVFENGKKKWENIGLTDKATILQALGLQQPIIK